MLHHDDPEDIERRKAALQQWWKSWRYHTHGAGRNDRRPADRTYLVAHACFDCRKSFKIANIEQDSIHPCPDCTKPLCLMGRFFRVPKRNDLEQWKKARALWNAGFRFWSCSGDGMDLPKRFRDVEAFARNNPRHPLRLRSTWKQD